MDFCAWLDGMELDLFDFLFLFVGGALFGEVGGAGLDAGVGGIDVVEEDFLGVVVGGCDTTIC